MNKRRWIWMLPLWLVAAGAHAQVSAGDKATAEALFDRGLLLMREGKLDEACTRLEQSQAIERGIGTMLYLAECYEKSGRTASAWALFREAASEAQAAGQVERAAAGRQRAERLEPSLAKLTLEVSESSRVPGLELVRNGTVIHKGTWGMPLPVDPGEQRIEVHAPGYQPHTIVVAVEKGSTTAKVDIPPLVPAPLPALSDTAAPTQAAPGPVMPADTSALSVAVTTSEPEGRSKLKLVGLIVGGAGVALLAVGTGFGVRAIHKNDDAKKRGCDGKSCADQEGVELTNEAITASRVANVGIFGGGALVAGGLLTYLLAAKRERQSSARSRAEPPGFARAPEVVLRRVALSTDSRGIALHVGGVF